MINWYEIVCFHLVFSFCVELLGMVKIMQKHAKLEQNVKKIENQGISRNSRLEGKNSRLNWIRHGINLGRRFRQSTAWRKSRLHQTQ